MKLIQQTILLLIFLFSLSVGYSAQRATVTTENASELSVEEATMNKAELKKAKKQARRAMFKSLFSKKGKKDELELIIYVILAIIIPPVAVFLYDDGPSNRFWLNLVLALLGIGIGSWLWLGGLGLLYTVAIVHALLIVLDII